MSGRPWDTDVPPTAADVAAVLAAQRPDMASEPVAYLDEGWDVTAFRLGERWVVRVPKREQTVRWMAREAVVLSALDGRVPAPIPRILFRLEPAGSLRFPAPVYEYLPGVLLDTLDVGAVGTDAGVALGEVVGRTLTVLHGLSCEDLPEASAPQDETGAWVPTSLAVLDACAGRLSSAVVSTVREVLENGPPAVPRETVTHGDLGPEHLLVDPTTHGLTGILDWTDAGPWDPAGDFVGLWAELGDPCLAAALAAYEGTRDAGLESRIRFHAARWLLYQVKHADAGWRPETRDRWLRRIAERFGAS